MEVKFSYKLILQLCRFLDEKVKQLFWNVYTVMDDMAIEYL